MWLNDFCCWQNWDMLQRFLSAWPDYLEISLPLKNMSLFYCLKLWHAFCVCVCVCVCARKLQIFHKRVCLLFKGKLNECWQHFLGNCSWVLKTSSVFHDMNGMSLISPCHQTASAFFPPASLAMGNQTPGHWGSDFRLSLLLRNLKPLNGGNKSLTTDNPRR